MRLAGRPHTAGRHEEANSNTSLKHAEVVASTDTDQKALPLLVNEVNNR